MKAGKNFVNPAPSRGAKSRPRAFLEDRKGGSARTANEKNRRVEDEMLRPTARLSARLV